MSQVPMIAPLENTLNVRSSLLIKCLNFHKYLSENFEIFGKNFTLIKCLKGHKSLGSLSNVKSKSTASESAALDS